MRSVNKTLHGLLGGAWRANYGLNNRNLYGFAKSLCSMFCIEPMFLSFAKGLCSMFYIGSVFYVLLKPYEMDYRR